MDEEGQPADMAVGAVDLRGDEYPDLDHRSVRRAGPAPIQADTDIELDAFAGWDHPPGGGIECDRIDKLAAFYHLVS
jgi:hypothetical protein